MTNKLVGSLRNYLAEEFEIRGKDVHFAVSAINFVRRGYWEKLIPLPKGVEYKGKSVLSSREIVEVFRLDGFLGGEGVYSV